MNSTNAARVLVIDDDELLRFALSRALELAKFEVRTASNGLEGVSIAREFRPAVIVCDVNLPYRDGPAVLASLREEEGLEATQFILMTGDSEGTSQRRGINLGADDYLAKPFSMEEFLRCVRARIRRVDLYRKADDHALDALRDTISKRLPHELLTPLTGILGLSEVLLEEIGQTTPSEAREMIADIRTSAERLHHTLKNYFSILDVLDNASPPSPGGAHSSSDQIDKVVREAVAAVTGRHGRSGDVTLAGMISDLPVSPSNLSAVVTEFVDNACKYSAAGLPIHVRLIEDTIGRTISVTDCGRGMSPAQIAQIGAFRQFDRTKYEQQGLGLGLTLTQHLLERNGGSFRLESKLGSGTTASAVWGRAAGPG